MIRLNKFIADAGVCSRREADQLILDGKIKVNDKVVTTLGVKVKENDKVTYNSKLLKSERFRYIILNKPRNFITTVKDTHNRKTVMDLIEGACKERVYPVGRLDRDTTGLLILTNDGELTKRLTHPSFGVRKKYIIQLSSSIHPDCLAEMTKGVQLDDGIVKYDEVVYGKNGTDRTQLIVTLHSGKNRVIRRTMEYFEKELLYLDRIEFAGIKKRDLQRGKWRFLDHKELGFLKMVKAK
ncbi:MAG: pseudouridine synthase [Bacteroidota bacterium]|jgi:23S rRNA pseudouridine2605 synthase|nr:pseudouridine synthase [Crocinitomicaceae bacterium]MEC9159962.1 pseudouridine synthase [Bacteroidota bacterium]|tara:strand:+ start:1097 stop:1813 length:717 start_codon:yes stop_codon:yes gene_type:complete